MSFVSEPESHDDRDETGAWVSIAAASPLLRWLQSQYIIIRLSRAMRTTVRPSGRRSDYVMHNGIWRK
jgi:hypothetical protein